MTGRLNAARHATHATQPAPFYPPSSFLYVLSLLLFLLALLSKTSVVALPVVLLLCVWWLRRADGRSLERRDGWRTLPFFAVAMALALVTIWFQYQHSIGTDVVTTGSFRGRLVGAGMAAWFYLARIVFPRHPTFVYPRWNFSPDDAVNYLPGAVLLGVWALCWWYRNRWGRPFIFALSYFLAMLFPVLGFFKIYFQKYSFVADHWLYPAMIGVIALIVGGGAGLVQRLLKVGRAVPARRGKTLKSEPLEPFPTATARWGQRTLPPGGSQTRSVCWRQSAWSRCWPL